MLEIVIIVLLGLIVYAWLLFPLLLSIAARIMARQKGSPEALRCEAKKAVLLSAHNEEQVITDRLLNLGKCADAETRILVGTDGCTDKTAAIVEDFARDDERIRLLHFTERRGKMAVLKDLVAAAMDGGAEVLVFTDANVMFDANAISKLCGVLCNEDVGGVCGRLVFVDGSETGASDAREGVYWRWETRLKKMESAVDSCLGANGAIYAIRASLFDVGIPDNTVIDDFVIGMKVREAGYRLVYEPSAIAREKLPELVSDEWARRVRIGAGDFQALSLCRRCLSPRYGVFSWMFVSHKVLRWLTPHLAILAFLASLLSVVLGLHSSSAPSLYVAGVPLFGAAVLFACTVIGEVSGARTDRCLGAFRKCHYFILMQAALFVGSMRFCRGNLKGYWVRTSRSSGD